MTVKKMSKILMFILVLAMVLGTVAMADQSDGTNTGNTTNDTYTITTAGRFENGTLTIKYDSTQSPLTAGATSKAIAKGTEVTILAEPKAGYELVALNYTIGETTTDIDIKTDGKFTLTGNATITPVFQAKSTLGGEKTADSFRLDAIAAAATTGRCTTRT